MIDHQITLISLPLFVPVRPSRAEDVRNKIFPHSIGVKTISPKPRWGLNAGYYRKTRNGLQAFYLNFEKGLYQSALLNGWLFELFLIFIS